MVKESGLDARCAVDGYDLSGDVNAMQEISGSKSALDMSALTSKAIERVVGEGGGSIGFTSLFNPATSRAHPVLSALPRSSRVITYAHRPTIGAPGASLDAYQLNYDGTRGTDAGFLFSVSAESTQAPLEWGSLLTAGFYTSTTGESLASIHDTTAATVYGAAAYVHLTGFTGSSLTISIEHSDDNGATDTWRPLAGTITVSAVGGQRLETGPDVYVKPYVRATLSGTYTSATLLVNFHRRPERPTGIEEISYLTADQVLFYSVPHVYPAGAATGSISPDEWQLGQNDDPDFSGLNGGFFFPNGTPGVDATYSFVRGAGPGGPGLNYIETKIFGVGGATSHASQLWRRQAWNAPPPQVYGSDLPTDIWLSSEIYVPVELAYTNTDGSGNFGFTNLTQFFGNIGVDMHMGIGKNSAHDTYQRYEFDYANSSFDLTQVVSPNLPAPTGRWLRNEQRYKQSTGSDGRWEVWADGIKILDFTGQTARAGTTELRMSIGMYGELITPTNPAVRYRKVGLTTTATQPYWNWH